MAAQERLQGSGSFETCNHPAVNSNFDYINKVFGMGRLELQPITYIRACLHLRATTVTSRERENNLNLKPLFFQYISTEWLRQIKIKNATNVRVLVGHILHSSRWVSSRPRGSDIHRHILREAFQFSVFSKERDRRHRNTDISRFRFEVLRLIIHTQKRTRGRVEHEKSGGVPPLMCTTAVRRSNCMHTRPVSIAGNPFR